MADRTPLYEEHVRLGARLVEFAGYLMPQQYTSIRAEQLAVRQSAGLFDLCHMGRLEVTGRGAFQFLQESLTNDLGRIGPGRAQYTLLCNEAGGIIDDLVVYWIGEARFHVVINGSTHEKDVELLRGRLKGDVQIRDVSNEVSLLALQGPKVEQFLPAATDLGNVPYFGLTQTEVCGVRGMVSRTGYTGEDGFEIFVPAEHAVQVWRGILENSAAPGAVLPCGLGARDVCRLEAGLRLYGSDMDESTNPYEAGLGWTVRLQKGEFVGRESLTRVKENGAERMTHGIRTPARVIPRHGTRVVHDENDVGEVTSGTYSFFLNSGIGMVRVKRDSAKPGDELQLDMRGQAAVANVVEMPFYRGSVKMPAPARSTA